jgi:hypothetical protein
MKELGKMLIVDEVFATFLGTYSGNVHQCRSSQGQECQDLFVPTDFDCLRSMIDTYEQTCGKFNDYSRGFIKYLVRECETPTMSHQAAKDKLSDACLK